MLPNEISAQLIARFYFSRATSETAQAIRILVEKALLGNEGYEYTPEEMEEVILEYLNFMDGTDDMLFVPVEDLLDDTDEEDIK